MPSSKKIKGLLKNLEPQIYFNIVEFLIFIAGIYLGMTQNKIYILVSIGYVALVYIIKILFEIKNEIASDLKSERDKIGSLLIQKNQSTILYSPYITKSGDMYEILLIISSMNKINNPELRIEYSSVISCENIIVSDFMEEIEVGSDHKSRINCASFNYYEEEELCVVNVKPRKKQGNEYFLYELKIPCVEYGKMNFSLIDGTSKHISNINFFEMLN